MDKSYYKDFSKFQPKPAPKPAKSHPLTAEEKYELYKKMSYDSIKKSDEKRKRIQKVEKKKADRRNIIVQIAIGILVSGLLIAAVDKKPHVYGHNGEILDSTYSDTRGR